MNKKKFVVVSFDGLRPDLVSASLTPNLHRLQSLGVTLHNHRTVYPSETRSAFPSLVTGATIDRHGMVGNKYVDRSTTPPRYIDTADANLLRELDLQSGGKLMFAPTIGEVLAAAGRTLAVLATNSPGTTRFFHHKAEDFGHLRLSGHFPEVCTPDAELSKTMSLIGPLPPEPPKIEPDEQGQEWITSAFLKVVWPNHKPDVTILSYGEPDITSHFHGTGSEATRRIIAYCDRQFGRLLDWWEAEGRSENIQLLAISDHGHITGHTRVSVIDTLRNAGFRPGTAPSSEVDVVVVPGQVGALYLAEPTLRNIDHVIAALTCERWCGSIFTKARNAIEGIGKGSLASHLVFADHSRAPDVSFSFRGSDDLDQFGLAGSTFFDNDRAIGLGVHGGLHPKELSALGIVAGTAFPAFGSSSLVPSGICDFAPTILHLLEIGRPSTMTGRVLHELLGDPTEANLEVQEESFATQLGNYSQVLRRVRVAGTTYIEGGTADE